MKLRAALAMLPIVLVSACTKAGELLRDPSVWAASEARSCLTSDGDGQSCRNAAQAEFDARGITAVDGRQVNP
jgi:hypothetical protein